MTAYDVNNGELVWENRTVQNIPTNPVYGSPGLNSLAELYVADGSNRIFALDANTGVELWNLDSGEGVTSLALNESTLFVAGNGYLKAFSRQNRNQLWRTPLFGGLVMGGPLVDATRALVVTESGNVYLLDNQNGSSIAGQTVTSFLGGAPALSGPWIFMPGVDGRVHDLLGSQ
jgi:outer membrane protein assembly factor BamB